MKSDKSHPDYFFGNTDAEHERLIRQAIRLAPVTERFFRDAGIAPGHRVLELGSGVGDVAMLVARIVGRSGEVVAIERDARTISRALARAAEAGLHNINFVQTDIAECLSNSWYGFSLHISKLFNYLYVIICSRLWKKSSSQV